MGGIEYDVVVEALRILFLVACPMIVAVALASTLVSALQAATAIHEPALGYAVRILTLLGLVFLLHEIAIESLISLTEMVFR